MTDHDPIPDDPTWPRKVCAACMFFDPAPDPDSDDYCDWHDHDTTAGETCGAWLPVLGGQDD